MHYEEKLKAAQAALRDIADMDRKELAAHGRMRALRALAFSDAPLPGELLQQQQQQRESDARAMEALIGRIEVVMRDVATEVTADGYPLTWVKVDRYVEISGDSFDSVQARRKAGKWLDGNQCKIVDGRLWINLPAVEEWVEKWDRKSPYLTALRPVRTSKTNRQK